MHYAMTLLYVFRPCVVIYPNYAVILLHICINIVVYMHQHCYVYTVILLEIYTKDVHLEVALKNKNTRVSYLCLSCNVFGKYSIGGEAVFDGESRWCTSQEVQWYSKFEQVDHSI